MAHQCLQCGASFPDGSAELLKGCSCGGTRFFYTQVALRKEEREALMKQANTDIRSILQELVQQHEGPARPDYDDAIWGMEARKAWLQVDANKLRAHEAGAVLPAKAPASEPHHPHPTEQKHIEEFKAAEQQRKAAPAKAKPAPVAHPMAHIKEPREAKPEVVVVQEPGNYDIDVEQLLDKSPVVVRRDGVYVVHLPSVFANAGKK
ncbi:MAG: Zn-ribbon domain-containing protein [Halobacteriales archaeon]|nr:Zn-ribbon domain-containing protein [Halobacteriales archaeon]